MSMERLVSWIDESEAPATKSEAFRQGWNTYRRIYRNRFTRGMLRTSLDIGLSVSDTAANIRADYYYLDPTDAEGRDEGDGMLAFLTALHVNADKIDEEAA